MFLKRLIEVFGGVRLGKSKRGEYFAIENGPELAKKIVALQRPEADLKFCPICLSKGAESNIYVSQKRPMTDNAVEEYYDTGGRLHVHNHNVYRMLYSCTNGHEWSESRRAMCWCGHE